MDPQALYEVRRKEAQNLGKAIPKFIATLAWAGVGVGLITAMIVLAILLSHKLGYAPQQGFTPSPGLGKHWSSNQVQPVPANPFP